MKGRAISYLPEELAFIEAHKDWPRRELHAAFCHRFGRTDVQLGAFKGMCKRRGWMTGRSGCFSQGQIPVNKGKSMPYNPNSAATYFKKGVRQGVAIKLHKPIGTERLSKSGYRERKINDDLPLHGRWRAVHLMQWEAINGPLPKGMCLKSLDGDKTNCDPSNWECIPRALLPRLNGRFGRNYDTADAEARPVILTIAKLEHAAREARKSNRNADHG